MGEIDDSYKQGCEDIDAAFLEELKNCKDHGKCIARYRMSLERARRRFGDDYSKFNDRERQRVLKMKKKVASMPKFKHLEISHFDFEFGVWMRFLMWVDVWWFGLVRIVRRFRAWVVPGFVSYWWAKFRNIFRVNRNDFSRSLDSVWKRVKKFFVASGVFVWGEIKGFWVWIKKVVGKVVAWVGSLKAKKGEKKEGEGKEEKEGDSEEKVEEKEEKVEGS